jgi:hypothetical protein
VWGTADALLPLPSAAARCPQLDVPLETAELILGFTSG